MKDTNAIEKALQQKVSAECRQIVDKFVDDLQKLHDKYGGSMFYDLAKDSGSDCRDQFHVQGTHGLTNVLHRMLLLCHGEKMLKHKSQELIKKLELI